MSAIESPTWLEDIREENRKADADEMRDHEQWLITKTKQREVKAILKAVTRHAEYDLLLREIAVRQLFAALSDKTGAALTTLSEIGDMLFVISGVRITDVHLIRYIMEKLLIFMHTTMTYIETSADGVQQNVIKTPHEHFGDIVKHDAHRNVPDKGCMCIKHCCQSCVFHTESLLLHLFAAAIISAMTMHASFSTDERKADVAKMLMGHTTDTIQYQCTVAFMTALLHDCAKGTTVTIVNVPCAISADGVPIPKNMGYPGHALVGAICVQLMHNPLRAMGITESSVDSMVRAIQMHMQVRQILKSGNLTQLLTETLEVRRLMSVLYNGDCLGKVSEPGFCVNPKDAVKELLTLNEWVMSATYKESMPIWSLFPSKSKIVLMLKGQSGSGKTHVSKYIATTCCSTHTCIVSSDVAMGQMFTGSAERPCGKKYDLMYKVKSASRAYYKSKSDETERLYRKAVHDARSGGVKLLPFVDDADIPDCKTMHTEEIKRQIQEALDGDCTYIVLDTVMTLYPEAMTNILPADIRSKAILVSVAITNWTLSKKAQRDSNGISPLEQAKLSGLQTYGVPANGAFNTKSNQPLWESSMSLDEHGMPMPSQEQPWRTDHDLPPIAIIPNKEGEMAYVGFHASLMHLQSLIGNGPSGEQQSFKDYSGCEYLQHLMNAFKNDVQSVRKKLANEFVNMNGTVIGGQWETMSEPQKTMAIEKFVHLSRVLFKHGVITRALTHEEFQSSDELCMKYIYMYCTLKYRENVNAESFWFNKYMLDFRGQKFFIHPETGKVTCLSYLMPRGKEVLNVLTKQQNAEYAGVRSGVFDIIQARIINPDANVNAIITSKADGSMVSVIVGQGYVLTLWKCYIEVYGTPEAQHIAKRSLELTDNKQVVIITTQGSLSLNDHMTSYILTSALAGIHKDGTQYASRDDLSKVSPLIALVKYGDPFLTDIINLSAQCYTKVPETESVTLIFEGICVNRQGLNNGLWRDDQHDELATNYEIDVLTWLGFSVTGVEGKWREGFITHSTVQFQHKFCEPFAWKVVSTKQINAMAKDMNEVIFNRMTKDEFLAIHSDYTGGEAKILDVEGFVCMVSATDIQEVDETHPDHLLYTAFSTVLMIYAKLKSEAYYKAHGYRVGNITYLINLESCAPGVFPLATKVSAIIASPKIIDLVSRFTQEIDHMFDVIKPDNVVKGLLEQTFGVYEDGDKDHPQYVLTGAKGNEREKMDSFIKRVLTPQYVTENSLCDKVGDMYIAIFIKDFNATFRTKIQTFIELEAIHSGNMAQSFKLTKMNALKMEYTVARNLIEVLMAQLKDLDALRRYTLYDSPKIIALLVKTEKLTLKEKDDATFFKTMVSLMLSSPLLQSDST